MDFISAIIYGCLQGLSEFLPVSSSGHLALLPFFLKTKDPGVLFDLSMHLGTALAVLVYFRKTMKTLAQESLTLSLTLVQRQLPSLKDLPPQRALALNMILSTLVTVLAIFFLKDLAGTYGRGPFWIALNLVFFGVLMWLADSLSSSCKGEKTKTFSPKMAVLIGLSQALAVFPGVSRSGITLTVGRFLKLPRREATHFSFFLSVPIILGGFAMKLPHFFENNLNFDLWVCLTGIVMSFGVGIATIHYFLKIIQRWGLGVFALYRIFLSIIIIFFLEGDIFFF